MKRRPFKPDADLDEELSEYEPSDSDEEYDDNEKLLLDKARKGKSLHDEDDDDEDDSEEEEDVLGVYSSDEEEGSNLKIKNDDSDIEGMEDDRLPDSKAWGKRKKDYYHTDYVDQDYGGFAREEEEIAAAMEEKEAKTLQNRLAAQLDGVDLSLGLLSKTKKVDQEESKISEEDVADIIKTDLTKLTKREKLALFKKESPEFFGLMNDYKERLTYLKDKLLPIVKLIESGRIAKNLVCSKFVVLKTQVIMNYCINLVFYLLLKKKRIQIKDHPISERLLKYRSMLQQLDSLEKPEYIEQLNDILDHINNDTISDLFPFSESSNSSNELKKKKKKLKLLSGLDGDQVGMRKPEDVKEIKEVSNNDAVENVISNSNDLSEDSDEYSDETALSKNAKLTNQQTDEEFGKRAITYEMAKNKGLTPHRKKEERNPRVKNRNKYRKALIKRKGQVRGIQSELKKYGGEIFGIKASVIKSRKLK